MRGDPSSRSGGATSTTYTRALQKKAKYMVKQFPVGTKVRFMQDGAGVGISKLVENS